jgi:hypothetical protein
VKTSVGNINRRLAGKNRARGIGIGYERGKDGGGVCHDCTMEITVFSLVKLAFDNYKFRHFPIIILSL